MSATHYHAAGRNGLHFACYDEASRVALANLEGRRPGLPERHSDLRMVNCPQCWDEIFKLAHARMQLYARV